MKNKVLCGILRMIKKFNFVIAKKGHANAIINTHFSTRKDRASFNQTFNLISFSLIPDLLYSSIFIKVSVTVILFLSCLAVVLGGKHEIKV